uniref:Uncharacterized protein n=1 Tax=Oryza barthii TaxID=65489 RepID=A0A0D3GQ23_9ORYZ
MVSTYNKEKMAECETRMVLQSFKGRGGDATGGADSDGKPRRPRHLAARRVGEEEGVEGAVLHELVGEQAVASLGAEADEADEVEVVRAADGGHLHPELLLPLSIPSSCFTATIVRFASTLWYTAPYFGLCRHNTHHSAHSHSTSPDTTPSTTHLRTPDALLYGEPPPPRGRLGIPGKQTLMNDVLGSATDRYPLTKLDTLRKQRPEPPQSAVEATHELPERQLRRQAVMPTKNCFVVISSSR